MNNGSFFVLGIYRNYNAGMPILRAGRSPFAMSTSYDKNPWCFWSTINCETIIIREICD